MVARQKDLDPPRILRAHRPKHADVKSSEVPATDTVSAWEVVTEDLPVRQSWVFGWVREHMVQIGLGMIVMLVIYSIGTAYVIPVMTRTIDHWNCGENRICHYDFNVGHNGKSHFIAEYWHDQVIVIEMQAGKTEQTHAYSQAITGNDNSPRLVTLTTAYISRHPMKGKPDLIATVSGLAIPVIFYNTGDGFTTEEPQ